MAAKFVEHPNVHPVFQHVGGEAVPQSMTADFLVDPGRGRCPLEGHAQGFRKYCIGIVSFLILGKILKISY